MPCGVQDCMHELLCCLIVTNLTHLQSSYNAMSGLGPAHCLPSFDKGSVAAGGHSFVTAGGRGDCTPLQ